MKLRKLLALAMAAVLAVSSASVAVAADVSDVSDETELLAALGQASSGDTITLDNDVSLKNALFIRVDDVIIDLNGHTITADTAFTGGSNATKNLVTVTADDVTIKGGDLVGTEKTRNVLHAYQADGVVIENLTLNHSASPIGAPLVVNSAKVTVKGSLDLVVGAKSWYGINVDDKDVGGSAVLTFATSADVSMTGNNSLAVIYVEEDTNTNPSVAVVGEEKVGLVEGANGSFVPEQTTPVTPPSDNNSNRSDNDDNSDYFGNETWDEVKDQIAEAEEGDTIKVSATGLPYFPSSVARALKGLDITLEIRKNGVTYEVNGLEIGDIDKIWYEFDELETELLTADADSEAPAAEDEDKANPDTGR